MTSALSNGDLIKAIFSHTLTTHFDVAASTLLVFDILLTLPREIDLVWKSEWNFMKALYLFQRYLPLIDTVTLTLYHQLGRHVSIAECHRIYYTIGWLMSFGFASSELILTLRAWAVWNRNKRLTMLLPIAWILVWGPVIGFQIIFLPSIKVGDPPYVGFPGCFVIKTNTALSLCFIMLMIWDTYKYNPNSTLFDVVYRDALSIFNVVAIKTFPKNLTVKQSGYQFLLLTLERCLHSILSSRVLLDLRLFARHGSRWSEGLTNFIAEEDER
ncbi:hypothetical protein GALMADRAFT_276742 [Galerina marginata CBS 339.88]|uniref:DUF6533 domain-containing protein n=1 Tax=Galerina marginata (strain CBS 339.88) TaxID=685588 RepID=A0A067TQH6_GALM3|nr:hypothetical protein GALMADRAFT_276742 [Galerina marginata CBS 339.88]